jgi:hypothetical protein
MIGYCIVSILAGWLAADFLTGVFHWVEDRYVSPGRSLDFMAGESSGEVLHHDKPTAMLLNSKWENIRSTVVIAWPLAASLYLFGFPLWIVLAFFFVAFGNLIHRYAHTPASQTPGWVVVMQCIGLFLSPDHHDSHHREDGKLVRKQDAMMAYCGMTDWLNPFLDSIRFWHSLELMLAVIGIHTVDKEPIL